MSLAKLEISHLRNIERAALNVAPGLNVLFGENGSGKTSVLESVYLLGRARSFRTAHSAQLIQFKQPEARVWGVIRGDCEPPVPVGLRLGRCQLELHLDGRIIRSRAELARVFPVQMIQPSSISLLEGAPRWRRQFMDWGTFHVEPTYLDQWRRFAKALNQRNALLKGGRSVDLEPWNREVAQYGTIVAEARDRYLALLAPCLSETCKVFFPGHSVGLVYSRGWKSDRELLGLLRASSPEDCRNGFSRWGPQRGDFSVEIDGTPARLYLSRGQTKLLVYALLLAQAALVDAATRSVCVLIDDLGSELDRGNRRRLLDLLLRRRIQCFVTALHREDIGCALDGDARLFHVEQGRVAEIQ